MSEAAAFESTLRQNPDDLTTWCAYADYLADQGDPRGEFMQVQLALEDEARPKDERDHLKKREGKLLAVHQRAWLGEFAPFVFDHEPSYLSAHVQFVRGWAAEVSSHGFSVEMVRAFGRAPEMQFVTRLLVHSTAAEFPATDGEVDKDVYRPGPDVPNDVEEYDAPALHALVHCPWLTGIRVFCYGSGAAEPGTGTEGGSARDYGGIVHEVVGRMPNLEELYLYAHDLNVHVLFGLSLPKLRILRIDHETAYPLDILAANPTLGRLTHLLCQPHAQRSGDADAYIRLDHLRALCRSPHLTSLQHLRLMLTDFGNSGAEEIVASGILKRVSVLNLSYGCIRDEGARLLAACPDLKCLKFLNLTMNALTTDGAAALNATGVPLKADQQHNEYPGHTNYPGWIEYLSYGDME